jgi:hypothetical protein
MKDAGKIAPMAVRMPDQLARWLRHQAIDNRRSLNGELVHRLEESQRQQMQKGSANAQTT